MNGHIQISKDEAELISDHFRFDGPGHSVAAKVGRIILYYAEQIEAGNRIDLPQDLFLTRQEAAWIANSFKITTNAVARSICLKVTRLILEYDLARTVENLEKTPEMRRLLAHGQSSSEGRT